MKARARDGMAGLSASSSGKMRRKGSTGKDPFALTEDRHDLQVATNTNSNVSSRQLRIYSTSHSTALYPNESAVESFVVVVSPHDKLYPCAEFAKNKHVLCTVNPV